MKTKKILNDARQELDALKTKDQKEAARADKERLARERKETAAVAKNAKDIASRIYLDIPRKAKEAVDRREHSFMLYEYSIDQILKNDSRLEAAIMDELKCMLERDGVDFKYDHRHVTIKRGNGSDPYTLFREEYENFWITINL